MSSLSQYFSIVAMKRLVAGELPLDLAKGRRSTQHEFNSTKEMTQLLGAERIEGKETMYIFLSDVESESISEAGYFSFYNSREGKPRTPEYRIYYSSRNAVVDKANEGDLLFLGRTKDDKEIFIIAEAGSTAEQQILWLFGAQISSPEFQFIELSEEKKNLGFVEKHILEAIGIVVVDEKEDFLDEMIKRFKGDFPDKLTFSKYARSKVKDANAIEDPDDAVVKWWGMEYELFKTLEKYIITKRLELGFGKNVEEFLKYSLSAHQRRKSRAGGAFENHLEETFVQHNLKFTPQAVLGKAKPDFIFPGEIFYNDPNFDKELLTMLGAKTTAKERWKQLIPETRIEPKHFITLEPSISTNQTNDMAEKKIQLIVPVSILSSYKEQQRKSIITLKALIEILKAKQNRAGL